MAAVPWRFSLLTLLGLIAVVAVACAALTNPTPLWACVVETGVLAMLTYGVLASVFQREVRRAFWIGLSIVGWGYVLLAAGRSGFDSPVSWLTVGNAGFATGQSYLVTTRIVRWWAEKREGSPWAAYPPPAPAYSAATLVPSVKRCG